MLLYLCVVIFPHTTKNKKQQKIRKECNCCIMGSRYSQSKIGYCHWSACKLNQAFFSCFQKTQGRKNLRLKKSRPFSAKNSTFWRFLRLQPKNSKEKIVHMKIFIWVDALNFIFMFYGFLQDIQTIVCLLW